MTVHAKHRESVSSPVVGTGHRAAAGFAPVRLAAVQSLVGRSPSVQRLAILQAAANAGKHEAESGSPAGPAAPARWAGARPRPAGAEMHSSASGHAMRSSLTLQREADGLRGIGLRLALDPVTRPFSPVQRSRRAVLLGGTIHSQGGVGQVIQRVGDEDAGFFGRIFGSFQEIAEYGRVALFSKIAGAVLNTATYLGTAIEIAIWKANSDEGANTIIPHVLAMAAQLAYFTKNLAGAITSRTRVNAKRQEYIACAGAWQHALTTCGAQPTPANIAMLLNVQRRAQRLYSELDTLVKSDWALNAGIVASLAGLMLAGGNVVAFAAEHNSWQTQFGPDWTTVLGILTLLMPMAQKSLDALATSKSQMPQKFFDVDVTVALAAAAPGPLVDDGSSGFSGSDSSSFSGFDRSSSSSDSFTDSSSDTGSSSSSSYDDSSSASSFSSSSSSSSASSFSSSSSSGSGSSSSYSSGSDSSAASDDRLPAAAAALESGSTSLSSRSGASASRSDSGGDAVIDVDDSPPSLVPAGPASGNAGSWAWSVVTAPYNAVATWLGSSKAKVDGSNV